MGDPQAGQALANSCTGLIYASAIAGVVHYIWLVKKDVRVPEIYAGILAVLLLYRIATWALNRKAATPRKATATAPLRTSASVD